MDEHRPITHEQFKDAARRLLLKKPNPDAVSEDYEPTQEELNETFRISSEQDTDDTEPKQAKSELKKLPLEVMNDELNQAWQQATEEQKNRVRLYFLTKKLEYDSQSSA